MDAENIAAEGRSGQPLLLSLGPTIKLVDSDTNECDDPPGTEGKSVSYKQMASVTNHFEIQRWLYPPQTYKGSKVLIPRAPK